MADNEVQYSNRKLLDDTIAGWNNSIHRQQWL